MILLDTNYLIRMLVAGSDEANNVEAWLRGNMRLAASAIAWYEFECGPVDANERNLVKTVLLGGIIAFDVRQSVVAARLFNDTGRSRKLRVDAMIASCAIVAECGLATANRDDFLPFVAHGLNLV